MIKWFAILICCSSLHAQTIIRGATIRSATLGTMGITSGGVVTANDIFNRADASPISNPMSDGVSTWITSVSGSATVQIVSNQAQGGGNSSIAKVTSPVFSANHKSTITLGTIDVGPMVRCQSGTSAGYLCYVSAPTALQVYVVSDGGSLSYVQLGADITVSTLGVGDTVSLSISGSTLTVLVNGVSQGTRTDSTYSTGQPGIYLNPSKTIDAFAAVDVP